MRVVWVALLFLGVTLAGCASEGGTQAAGDGAAVDRDSFQLQAGTGAIAGLLVDDRFRPIHLVDNPQGEFQTTGFVLLQETGEQVRTNENGEFTFVNLAPGQYTLRVTAAGHEAIPQRATVAAGVFNELSVIARRTASEGSFILTQEFSAFIPCSIRFIANGIVLDCLADSSGDSFRASFRTNYTAYGDEVTYLITEMKASREAGLYRIQMRNEQTSPWTRYATANEYEVDYIRILNQYGVANEMHNFYGDNQPFQNDRYFDTVLFVGAMFEEEMASLGQCCGLGLEMGIQAQFVQSVFLGPPEVDINAYCVLC